MAEQGTSRDGILRAHADGRPVEEIERTYGVSRAEIEQILAAGVQLPPASKPRVPGTVMAAMLLVAGAGLAAVVRLSDTEHGWQVVVPAAFVLLVYGWIDYGLWLGKRVAQVLALIGGALAVLDGLNGALLAPVTGAALVGVLLVPKSAREWFARR